MISSQNKKEELFKKHFSIYLGLPKGFQLENKDKETTEVLINNALHRVASLYKAILETNPSGTEISTADFKDFYQSQVRQLMVHEELVFCYPKNGTKFFKLCSNIYEALMQKKLDDAKADGRFRVSQAPRFPGTLSGFTPAKEILQQYYGFPADLEFSEDTKTAGVEFLRSFNQIKAAPANHFSK